jgi:hypothetical protein
MNKPKAFNLLDDYNRAMIEWEKSIQKLKELGVQKQQKRIKKQREAKAAIQFFQMTQAVSEIATIDTTKLNENNRKHVGASI